MQPINYLLENKNPMDMLMGGVQQWQSMKNNDYALARTADENRLLKAQHDNEIQGMADLQGLDFNNLDHVRQYAARYPALSKGVTSYMDNLEEKEKQAMLGDMSKSIALLRNNRSDVAISEARSKAEAYKNSGNTQKAAEYQQIADWMEKDPTSAMQGLTMSYAMALPKDAASNYAEMTKAMNPEFKQVDTGNGYYGYSVDPLTGQAGGAQWIADKGASPDAQLQANTQITTTGMNNQSAQNVANINGQYGNQQAQITGQFGLQREQINQQGQNDRTQAQLQLDAQKLYFQQQQAEIDNRKAELKEAGGKMWVVYKDGSYKPALDQSGQQMAATSSAGGANSTAAKQQEEGQRTQRVSTVLDDIEKILPKATGSMVGTGIDKAAGLFGVSTEGATATAQLQSLSGQLVALMPKMSGPQSDKDVLMYKQMAGQLDDPTKPIAQRQAALQTIRALNNKYAQLNGTGGQPAQQGGGFNMANHFTGD